MIGFAHVRRLEKKHRTNFYGAIILMYTIWKCWNILLQRIVIAQKSLWISCHFDTENCSRRLDVVQKKFCLVLRHFVSKYVLENI